MHSCYAPTEQLLCTGRMAAMHRLHKRRPPHRLLTPRALRCAACACASNSLRVLGGDVGSGAGRRRPADGGLRHGLHARPAPPRPGRRLRPPPLCAPPIMHPQCVHAVCAHTRRACERARICSPCMCESTHVLPVQHACDPVHLCVHGHTHTHVCVRACVGACGSWGRGGRRRADHILLEKPMADNEADCAAIGEVRMQHRAVGLSCF